jgi:peptidoglycan/LPS O-acetylase OafA/YrhL
MFGTYRTLLALVVVVNHLMDITIIGQFAVNGFFILSGYLMTFIMCQTYGYSLKGISSFAQNRFLRLFPTYWMIILLTIVMIAVFGSSVVLSYHSKMYIPTTLLEWLQNLSLVFFDTFPKSVGPRLSPPTWALTVELFFYLAIGLGASKNKLLTILWLLAGISYISLTHYSGLHYAYRYEMILAGSLPFSIGACIFHFKEPLSNFFSSFLGPKSITLLFLIFVLNAGLASALIKHSGFNGWFNLCYYLNYLLNMVIVISLIKGSIPFISRKADQVIGDYSYPIYLCHWQAGFLSSMMIFGEPLKGNSFEGIVIGIVAIILCIGISWLIIQTIDGPVNALRNRIRKNANIGFETKKTT